MEFDAILAGILAASLGSGFFYWLLKRSIDAKLKHLELQFQENTKEQARRSAKVFDSYFEGIFGCVGYTHDLMNEIGMLLGEVTQNSTVSAEQIDRISRQSENVIDKAESLRILSARNSLVLGKDVKEPRRSFHLSMREYAKSLSIWLENPEQQFPLIQLDHAAGELKRFTAALSEHEEKLKSLMEKGVS